MHFQTSSEQSIPIMNSNKVIAQLERIVPAEREQWLVDYLFNKLKLLLLIDQGEYLPPTQNYFELGLTSLKLEEFKQEIESELDRTAGVEIFFNNPTVASLVAHLRNVVLKGYFPTSNVLVDGGESRSEMSYANNLQDLVFNDFSDSKFNEQDILDRALKSLGLSNF